MEKLNNFLSGNIKDKRVFVTNGTSAIGLSTIEMLISCNARVFAFSNDKTIVQNTFDKITSKYPGCQFYMITADDSEEGSVHTIFEAADDKLGGIDILINTAPPSETNIIQGPRQEWRQAIEKNLLSYMEFTEPAVKRMSEGGHIINVGSMNSEIREHRGNVYVSTSNSMQGFTSALRKEVNPARIKVSLIEPGEVNDTFSEGPDVLSAPHTLHVLDPKDIALSILFCLAQPQHCDVVTMRIRPFSQVV